MLFAPTAQPYIASQARGEAGEGQIGSDTIGWDGLGWDLMRLVPLSLDMLCPPMAEIAHEESDRLSSDAI